MKRLHSLAGAYMRVLKTHYYPKNTGLVRFIVATISRPRHISMRYLPRVHTSISKFDKQIHLTIPFRKQELIFSIALMKSDQD